ncbi:MAG: DMT family transporter [Burkholderiaceae bacterium]
MSLASLPTPAAVWPALALVFNALVWGVSWWPFRQMQAEGLHPLWATVFVFALCTVVITCWRPHAVKEVWRTPALWVLVLAAGTTNAAFNWAVSIGDVVRVVLLFYLMPLWTVLLARWLLHEPLTVRAALQVVLALTGAAVVLWPQQGSGPSWWHHLPLPTNLAEVLGVLGGLTFALNNVMLRKEAHRSEAARGWAMFFGGVLVAGVLAAVLTAMGSVATPPSVNSVWLAPALVLTLLFLASNMALQYGAARLPANVTSVIMLSEVVFASASAVLLGAGELTLRVWVGGALIVSAALLATLSSSKKTASA